VSFEGKLVKNHSCCWIHLANSDARIVLRDDLAMRFDGGESVRILTRPEDMEILPGGEIAQNQLPGRIEQVAYLGDRFEYHVLAAGVTFVLEATKKSRFSAGSEVRLSVDPARFTVRSSG
jgi:ABC-type Fe3+/spermidine/putrescine transport system ATPase subunit